MRTSSLIVRNTIRLSAVFLIAVGISMAVNVPLGVGVTLLLTQLRLE